MARRNRVTPDGEIVAHPGRGRFMGNRGCLHDEAGRIRRPYATRTWITCALAFKDRKRALMAPGRYTELFFLDEAVALAAGHRPCAECRREDYRRWTAAWQAAFGGPTPRAAEMDAVLHRARIDPATGRPATHLARLSTLPDGAFLRLPDIPAPLLRLGDRLFPYDPGGYGVPVRRPVDVEVTVLTPGVVVEVLKAGYGRMGREPTHCIV